MNIQTPASRRNDPETSRMAERQITDSGKRQTHQRIIAAFVAGHPGHTAAEIGEKTGLGQHECARRLAELKGISVVTGSVRRCAVKGTRMMTWYPA